jgi:hypothetical protein
MSYGHISSRECGCSIWFAYFIVLLVGMYIPPGAARYLKKDKGNRPCGLFPLALETLSLILPYSGPRYST